MPGNLNAVALYGKSEEELIVQQSGGKAHCQRREEATKAANAL
jgi:hypothetical protein